MGVPAKLSDEDRKESEQLALDIIESVCDDSKFPFPGLTSLDQDRVLMLAQTLIDWRRRAVKHGCDPDRGDPDCG